MSLRNSSRARAGVGGRKAVRFGRDNIRAGEREGVRYTREKGQYSVKPLVSSARAHSQMTMGAPAATLPISSSSCIIFFIRAVGNYPMMTVQVRSVQSGRCTGEVLCGGTMC